MSVTKKNIPFFEIKSCYIKNMNHHRSEQPFNFIPKHSIEHIVSSRVDYKQSHFTSQINYNQAKHNRNTLNQDESIMIDDSFLWLDENFNIAMTKLKEKETEKMELAIRE